MRLTCFTSHTERLHKVLFSVHAVYACHGVCAVHEIRPSSKKNGFIMSMHQGMLKSLQKHWACFTNSAPSDTSLRPVKSHYLAV